MTMITMMTTVVSTYNDNHLLTIYIIYFFINLLITVIVIKTSSPLKALNVTEEDFS